MSRQRWFCIILTILFVFVVLVLAPANVVFASILSWIIGAEAVLLWTIKV